jgi:purine-binding chemotaxis protein CheW
LTKAAPTGQQSVEAEFEAFAEQPDLQHLEKLFSGLQQQVDIEIEPQAEPSLEQPVIDEARDAEIQGWDVEALEADAVNAPEMHELDTLQSPINAQETVEVADSIEVAESVGVETQPDVANGGGADKAWVNNERTESFQVLYFDVGGMTFAVPLDELGGIHQIGELSHLIGRPAWYLGLQSSRESQLDVVDTAMWVMPDVLKDDSYKEDYQYIVMLGESNWGLAATELKGTEQLQPVAVRWREKAGKRPWLAGMVKQQMCALVHVSELIDMLNAGLDVKSVQ